MFYVGFFPALILFVGMFFVPETPRWLIGKGREEEGRMVLKRVKNLNSLKKRYRKSRQI
jgi:hypothetical protein